jgi:hypothetical protein
VRRVYASLPYNVTLQLKEGKIYAHFSWSEALPPPVHTEANGVLGVDVNADPYHLALAVAGKDGNLLRYLTLSLEEVDRAPNKGTKEPILGEVFSLGLLASPVPFFEGKRALGIILML